MRSADPVRPAPNGEPMQSIFDAAEDLTTDIDGAAGCLSAVMLMIDQIAPNLQDKGASLLAVVGASRLYLDRARADAAMITRRSME